MAVDAYRLYRRGLVVARRASRLAYLGSIRVARKLTRPFRTGYHGLSLKLVHDNISQIKKSDVILVTCLRNEIVRMPFFFDYYRKIGVNHFLIIDNDSSDGFIDYARQRADCSVWHTRASYRGSAFGMQWCNYLLRRFGVGHLCVTVDPDEFLIYPFMETRSLQDLGQSLKDERRECAHALMVDAYSDLPVGETKYMSGDDPFVVCPYFDRDGYAQRPGELRSTFVQGGPRMRVYFRDNPGLSPALNKAPVVWWQRDFAYRKSMHDLEPRRLNLAHSPHEVSLTCCLFHFKYVSTLIEKAEEEAQRREHFAGGREYAQYRNRAQTGALYEDGISVRYEGCQQLIDLGLMCAGEWV